MCHSCCCCRRRCGSGGSGGSGGGGGCCCCCCCSQDGNNIGVGSAGQMKSTLLSEPMTAVSTLEVTFWCLEEEKRDDKGIRGWITGSQLKCSGL